MIRDFIKKLTARKPIPGGIVLTGTNDTFKHTAGRLSIDLLITPAREDEFQRRSAEIKNRRIAKVTDATKNYRRIVSDAIKDRDIRIEDAEATWRRDMRALFIEFNQIGDEAPAPKAPPAVGSIVINGKTTSQDLSDALDKLKQNATSGNNGSDPTATLKKPARRRIKGQLPTLERKDEAGIPDRIADVLAEKNPAEQH